MDEAVGSTAKRFAPPASRLDRAIVETAQADLLEDPEIYKNTSMWSNSSVFASPLLPKRIDGTRRVGDGTPVIRPEPPAGFRAAPRFARPACQSARRRR